MLTKTKGRGLAAALTLAFTALALAGCGSSADPALVQSAGKHGNLLETNYALLASEVLKNASTRDLKDVNAALKAGDPKKATPGDLRRAQGEIEHRINVIASYRKKLAAANVDLRRAALPDWSKYLDASDAVSSFSADYASSTKIIRQSGTATLSATTLALNALERYLDFLEQWEEYVTSDDSAGFESSAQASDKAVATLERRKAALARDAAVSGRLQTLAGEMADAASDDSQLNDLIDSLKNDYPKSYLAVHIVEG